MNKNNKKADCCCFLSKTCRSLHVVSVLSEVTQCNGIIEKQSLVARENNLMKILRLLRVESLMIVNGIYLTGLLSVKAR